MRTEDDLRDALATLERHAPAAAAVLPAALRGRRGHGLRSPQAIRLLAGITTAAALAGVVTALTLPGATGSHLPNGRVATAPAQAASSLRAKLLAAFSAASGQIVYEDSTTTVSTTGTPMTTQKWYYPWQASPGQQVRSRQLILGGDGTPVQDVEDIYTMPAPGSIPAGLPPAVQRKLPVTQQAAGVVAAIGEIIDVEYGTRTWSDQKDHLLLDNDPASPQVVMFDIENEHWAVVGTTELDGHEALELAWTDADSSSYLWVDASTYLPLREQDTFWSGPAGQVVTTTSSTSYELLAPTAANLALLTPPIPAGFRQTATQVLPYGGPGLG